ncbi:MAG: PEGA domain-containing protein, partial [Deltaproteobacteria bacterium]|nr:PEGA domain-containing protein [Deltaproteobacteria bacterium]
PAAKPAAPAAKPAAPPAKPAAPATKPPAPAAAPGAKAAAPAKPAAKPAAKPPAKADDKKTAMKAKPGDKKAAGAAFKKGKDAFEKKDYKAAKESFTEAEEILPNPVAEYYIARANEELGALADAAKYYDKALESGKLKEEQASDAKTRVEALRKKPAKVKVTSDPPGAAIFVDGTVVPEKTPAEIEIVPGTHKILVRAEGKKDSEQSVEVAAFTGAAVDAKLEEAPPAPPPPVPVATTPPPAAPATTTTTVAVAPDTGKKDMTWVYVTGGAAIVALGVGTVFGLQALSDKSKFDDAVTAGKSSEARDHRDTGTRNALISDMGFGIGITLAVTSAVLFFTRPTPEEGKAAVTKPVTKMSFAPVVTPTTGGLAATINF